MFTDVNAVQLLNIPAVSVYMFRKSAETSPLSLKALPAIELRRGTSIALNAVQWSNVDCPIDETLGIFTHVRLVQCWNKLYYNSVIFGRSIEIRLEQQRNAEDQLLLPQLPLPVMLETFGQWIFLMPEFRNAELPIVVSESALISMSFPEA